MKKLMSLIYKDFLLLIRDRVGLIFLFLMPTILVIVMTGMQEGAVESTTKKSVSTIILNSDNEKIGDKIVSELSTNTIFNIINADSTLSENDIERLVKDGTYMVGVCIPKGTTQKMEDNIQICIDAAFVGMESSVAESKMKPLSIKIFVDPAMDNTFSTTLMYYLKNASNNIEKEMIYKKISEEVNEMGLLPIEEFNLSNIKAIDIQEFSSANTASIRKVNVTDHNVPAWTLFAIFFIVISLSGNIIKEKEDGSYMRLMTMPCTYATYLISKVIVYVIVCMIQFLIILLIGRFLFPILDLPVFDTNGNLGYCLIIIFFSSIAAIGFGLLISTFANSHQQASIIGAVSVVLFSAIGGIWVPTFLMPDFLETISVISPLNWGIEAFYNIILREQNFMSILPECICLFSFSFICFVVSLLYKRW